MEFNKQDSMKYIEQKMLKISFSLSLSPGVFIAHSFLFRASSMSPNARMARISSLENMLSISSNSLVAMASQLSEAEERERAFTNRGRWTQLRSLPDAKNLLQYMFNSLADSRYTFFNLVMFSIFSIYHHSL